MTILIWLMLGVLSRAEDKTCAIKGMECQGCVDMVKDKICDASFSLCDVKVGQAHLVTKEKAGVIDIGLLNKKIASTTYSFVSCQTTARSN